MTLTLFILGHDFAYEMECVVRIFFAGAKIRVVNDKDFTGESDAFVSDPAVVTLLERINADSLRLTVRTALQSVPERAETCEIVSGNDGEIERTLAAMLFRLLSAQLEVRPLWGILTGIRPVRLCEQWSEAGLTGNEINRRLTEDYLVSQEKAKLCIETGNAQKKILSMNEPDTFSLYVSIPFCPTRCLYCSFVSQAVAAAAKLIPEYVSLLCEELRQTGVYAKQKNLRLLSIYVGGGTPTSLTPAELQQVLEAVNSSFDLSHLLEYTVEAGRPDTITSEKLELLRRMGVDRISVNPQSMNDRALKAIGRAHTSGQVVQSVILAQSIGFKSINMDLIAGLPEDTPESFAKTIDKVLSLKPENITVHTLTVKRSSRLRENENAFIRNPDTAKMLELAFEKIRTAGYFPYYLYRQKATVENLENIGFSKPGHEGVYNIYSMEDRHNILASGAGGVSKLLKNGGIGRIFNFKYPFEYISRFDEIIKRKIDFDINA